MMTVTFVMVLTWPDMRRASKWSPSKRMSAARSVNGALPSSSDRHQKGSAVVPTIHIDLTGTACSGFRQKNIVVVVAHRFTRHQLWHA
eukprot:351773-Chlamydomonas_euryale.AAC.13